MSTRRGQSSRKRPIHLPTIAPKDDVKPLKSSKIAKATIVQPRLRFPPRSRTGCWTCRSRKIKCDEVHPQCNQCARLGHVCDYQPRLCFRDDTRRVMDRMPDVKTKGNSVWDPTKLSTRRERLATPDSMPFDLLPDFSMLTSDEDREKKAQGSVPGTYHVVVVPESFTRLPEYTEDALEHIPTNPYLSPLSEYSTDPMDEIIISDDPNVVILNQFRDTRKQVYASRRSHAQSPESDSGSAPMPAAMMYTSVQEISDDQISDSLDLETYDMALFDHFQNVVWMQLIPNGHDYMVPNIFEQEASNFPPLLHVMMAVSALSLVRQGDARYMGALHYYDQAMPSLQSSLENCDDVLSDGLFLTHFLLLVYQITCATAGHGSSSWSHHMSRLLQMSLLRQSVAERERFPLIIWLICHVDLYALFSGAGAGHYVRAVVESHLLPDADSVLYSANPKGMSLINPEEYNTQSLIMRRYRECFVLAARLGLLAAAIRVQSGPLLERAYRELEDLRWRFEQLWTSQEIQILLEHRSNLPRRSQNTFHKFCILFHTSLLFSCSIIGDTCTRHPNHELEKEIQLHSEAILHLAEKLAGQGRHSGPIFINFPLFLAGAVTSLNSTKLAALELLMKRAETELGYDAAATGSLLRFVCEMQLQHRERFAKVDWVEVAANHGIRMLNYG
ncbi:hypothetical protein BDV18DRAFT_135309 [Aspergillus unguis]